MPRIAVGTVGAATELSLRSFSMGYKYDRGELLDAAVASVLDDGVGRLTFGRLAKRVGINDRSIVYYFPTKRDLLTEVVMALGQRFQSLLDGAFVDDELETVEVVRLAWPVLISPDAEPVFRIYFEMVGLAAAGTAPFDELTPMLIDHWIDWLAPRVAGASAALRRENATAAVALVDGLLLLHHMVGKDAARAAAIRLGVV